MVRDKLLSRYDVMLWWNDANFGREKIHLRGEFWATRAPEASLFQNVKLKQSYSSFISLSRFPYQKLVFREQSFFSFVSYRSYPSDLRQGSRALCFCPTPEVRDSRTSCQIWQIWLAENMKRILCTCSELSIAGARRRRSGWSWALGTRMCVGWVAKFEMEGNVLKAFLTTRKELHFIKFSPPFNMVGSFSEIRFRGAYHETLSSDSSMRIPVSKKLNCYTCTELIILNASKWIAFAFLLMVMSWNYVFLRKSFCSKRCSFEEHILKPEISETSKIVSKLVVIKDYDSASTRSL